MCHTSGKQKLVCLCKLRLEEGFSQGEVGEAVVVRTQILIFFGEGPTTSSPEARYGLHTLETAHHLCDALTKQHKAAASGSFFLLSPAISTF